MIYRFEFVADHGVWQATCRAPGFLYYGLTPVAWQKAEYTPDSARRVSGNCFDTLAAAAVAALGAPHPPDAEEAEVHAILEAVISAAQGHPVR